MTKDELAALLAGKCLLPGKTAPFSRQIAWSSWNLYRDCSTLLPSVTEELRLRIIAHRSTQFQSFDYICGAPDAGVPLATALSIVLHKGLLYLPAKSAFPEWKVPPSPRSCNILLVDSVVKTGTTLTTLAEKVAQLGCRCVGAATISVYDKCNRIPKDKITNWINEGSFIYLFTISELENTLAKSPPASSPHLYNDGQETAIFPSG